MAVFNRGKKSSTDLLLKYGYVNCSADMTDWYTELNKSKPVDITCILKEINIEDQGYFSRQKILLYK